MIKFLKNVIKYFPEKVKSNSIAKAPPGNGLFNQGKGGRLPTKLLDIPHDG